MGSEVVVFLDGFLELASDLSDVVRGEVGLPVEVFSECSVGSLDASVVFWACGWEDEERDVELLAGLFELPHELGSAVDLDGFDFEWCCFDEFAEESLCGCACCI